MEHAAASGNQLHAARFDGPRLQLAAGDSRDPWCFTLLVWQTLIASADDDGQVLDALTLAGHLLFAQGQPASAAACYERVMAWEPDSVDPVLLARLAQFYAGNASHQRAKELSLLLVKALPCASAWLGVGVASLALQQWQDAEKSLTVRRCLVFRMF